MKRNGLESPELKAIPEASAGRRRDTARRVSRRKVEQVTKRAASELAGVAPESQDPDRSVGNGATRIPFNVPRGIRFTCHAETMMVHGPYQTFQRPFNYDSKSSADWEFYECIPEIRLFFRNGILKKGIYEAKEAMVFGNKPILRTSPTIDTPARPSADTPGLGR